MNIQTFYPVFEDGQVLTSGHLNEIIDYLEPQDRLTRSRLTGIGIVCGLEPDWNAAAKTLTLSCGVAVTSEGYLIAEDEVVLNRFRPYTVPIPSGSGAMPEEKTKARYPFLFDGNTQRQAFELLPTDFQPAAGDAAPTALSSPFVADKTVMLLLECNLEALKNCDVNDCSDKGSERTVTLRRLLVTQAIADKILAEEEAIAGRPVDRANHPRLGLERAVIDKINPSLYGIDTVAKLYERILSATGDAAQQLLLAMRDAWSAYQPLLEDMYSASRFPDGPIPDHHLLNPLAAFAETPVLAQYLYDAVHDMVRSHNEFIECAARFDAECCPDPARFPRHVLTGDVLPLPVAFAHAPKTVAAYASYDPLAARGGPAPEGPPAARRHHFVPSPALDAGNDWAAELRSVFARMVLLAQTYATRGLLGEEIRLTPSRDGAASLGERAIPFYYKFEPSSDLFRNWSWRKARSNLMGTIPSYPFSTPGQNQPLLLRQDDQDFIRIEGVVGKPLGTAMGELIQQKQKLGVSFAIEPVFLGFGTAGSIDPKLYAAAASQAFIAIKKLLLCRMRDLDVIFLVMMAMLFAFLVKIIQALGQLDATKATRKQAEPAAGGGTAPPAALNVSHLRPVEFIHLDVQSQSKRRATTEKALASLRKRELAGGEMVKRLVVEAAGEKPLAKVAVGSIYDKVRDPSAGGELIDRVRIAAGELGLDANRDEVANAVYPSVALMARAEEMMQVASAPSIAEFDETKFDTAFRGFADAYETYAAHAEIDAAKSSQEIAAANAAIVANRGTVAAAVAQFTGAGITAELGKRLQSMFEDLLLPGYARKHPGLEHKAGVPVGGTFVLLYGLRSQLAEGLKATLAELAPDFASRFAKLTQTDPPELQAANVIKEILASSAPQSEDVLDQFVVLGDFCLPYRCCDSDCSDIEIEKRILKQDGVVRVGDGGGTVTRDTPTPGPGPEPDTPARVRTGAVEVSVFQKDPRTGRTVALQKSILVVTDLANNRSSKQQLTAATHKLELAAGAYNLVATADRRKSNTVKVTVKAGATSKARLVIA